MARSQRLCGKGKAPVDYGRHKNLRAEARDHRFNHNIEKTLREAEALDDAKIHCDLLNSFKS